MSVLAVILGATINTFLTEEMDDKTKRDVSWVALSTFLYQVVMAAKHKDIAIKILEALIEELKDALPG